MAAVLSDPCRAQILEMLGRRPISASQFAREFGGEVSGIARRFRQLARWGYAEVCEERSGRRGGVSVERIYRLKRVAMLDTSAWDALPASGQASRKRRVLEPYLERLKSATAAGILDRDPDSNLYWDFLTLDRHGWRQLGEQLERTRRELLSLHVELHPDSAARSNLSAVEVGLCLFRSVGQPPSQARRGGQQPMETQTGSDAFIDSKFAKAASNRWRARILEVLIDRPVSPSQFVEEQGGDPSYIARCFRELAALGFAEVVEERRGGRRGGVERIYGTPARIYFDAPTWEALPLALRTEVTTSILASFLAQLSDAVKTGSIDVTGRHLSWNRLEVDTQGWQEVSSCLETTLDPLPRLEAESFERSRSNQERLVRAIVGTTSFRLPGNA